MINKSLFFISLPVFSAFWMAAATAGPIADKAAEIEALIAADDSAGAGVAAVDLYSQVWDSATTISFRQVALVAEPAAGFGVYNLRTTDQYKVGEPVIIYAEPYGYGFGTPAEGLYAIGFVVDLKVMAQSGEVLGEIPNLTELELQSRAQNHEFQANLTYTLDGITPGKYVLQTTLRDKNSAKTGTFETAIEIIE